MEESQDSELDRIICQQDIFTFINLKKVKTFFLYNIVKIKLKTN